MCRALYKFVVNRKRPIDCTDSRSVDSHRSIVVHNSNRSCIRVAHHAGGRIPHTDYRTFLADSCKRVDGVGLRSELVAHMSRHRKQVDTRDSNDRMPRDLDNLRCTDNGHEHTRSMDFLVCQPGKCNWLDDSGPNIRHHDHIASVHACMG